MADVAPLVVVQTYWAPGNGAAFLDLVAALTGAPLTGDAWVHVLEETTEDKVRKEKSGYEGALKLGPLIPAGVPTQTSKGPFAQACLCASKRS